MIGTPATPATNWALAPSVCSWGRLTGSPLASKKEEHLRIFKYTVASPAS